MGFFARLFGRESGPAPAAKSLAPAPAAAAATCPRCERRMLPGVPCPFCNPQQFGDAVQESTVSANYKPQKGVKSLAGVIVADQAAQQHGAKGFLYVYEGANKGATILLGGKFVSIGRSAGDNVLPVNDGGVSTKHCEVRPIHGGFQVVDLGSKNGTFLNDARVKEKALASGDVIGFGSTRIYVSIY
jgi:hypothetical protein